jgi:FtsH-binding integral membrane protein
MSIAAAQAAFWGYAALMGLSLAGVFLVYTGVSVARVFFITAATFGAMSLYGYTTRRDLSQFGSFLLMGLIGIVLASLVNIFIASSALQFAISVIGVVVFTGLTAWDTQRIKGDLSSERCRRRTRQKGADGRARTVSRLHQPLCPAAAIDWAAAGLGQGSLR